MAVRRKQAIELRLLDEIVWKGAWCRVVGLSLSAELLVTVDLSDGGRVDLPASTRVEVHHGGT